MLHSPRRVRKQKELTSRIDRNFLKEIVDLRNKSVHQNGSPKLINLMAIINEQSPVSEVSHRTRRCYSNADEAYTINLRSIDSYNINTNPKKENQEQKEKRRCNSLINKDTPINSRKNSVDKKDNSNREKHIEKKRKDFRKKEEKENEIDEEEENEQIRRKAWEHPSMWEVAESYGYFFKNKQRLISNFEFNKFKVEPKDKTLINKTDEGEISFEDRVSKFPNLSKFYERTKNKEEIKSGNQKFQYIINYQSQERPSEPIIKIEKAEDQTKSVNESVIDTSLHARHKSLNRTLRRGSRSRASGSCSIDTSQIISNNETQNIDESKTFLLTAPNISNNSIRKSFSENQEQKKKNEVIHIEDNKTKNMTLKEEIHLARKLMEKPADLSKLYINQNDVHERLFEKVKKAQNDIIRKYKFSPAYQRPLRIKFERILAYLSGKSNLGSNNLSLVDSLKRELAMPISSNIP